MSGLVPVQAGVILSAETATIAVLVPRFLAWFQFVRERAEHTIAAYAFDLRTFVNFCERVGIEHPDKVRLQMVEAYLATLRHERKLGVATVNRHRSCLNQFFAYLEREEIVRRNPVTATVMLKQPQRVPKRLTLRERDHVLAALAEDETPIGKRDLAIVATGCFAGLRCEEMTTLRVDNVDLDTGRLVVIGKGDKQREVPIVARLAEILRRYLDVRGTLIGRPVGELYRRTPTSVWRIRYPTATGGYTTVNTHTYSRVQALGRLQAEAPRVPASPYVFVNAAPRRSYALRRGGKPLETRTLFSMVRKKVTPLVGRPVSPHHLRHTFASVLTDKGANAFVVQHLMGHTQMETTARYVHLADETLRTEVEKHL